MSDLRRRNVRVFSIAILTVAGMVGMSFASVPLYRIFCQVTGYGGTTQTAAAAPGKVLDRVITVRFDSNVDPGIPWSFKPGQPPVEVRLGEERLAFFHARNRSSQPVTGTAAFNVSPPKAGLYFNKIDCFCFTEQRLAAGEEVDMPVTFFIDPELAKDRNLDDLTEITLSYTFYRAEDDGKGQSPAAPAKDPAKVLN